MVSIRAFRVPAERIKVRCSPRRSAHAIGRHGAGVLLRLAARVVSGGGTREAFRVWQIGTGQYSWQCQGVADRNRSVFMAVSGCGR